MPLTLAQIYALITDGGANTAADVRAALQALYHRQYGIGADPDTNDVYWDGDDVASGTTVTVTGSQTIIEEGGLLSVRYDAQAANDLNCLLFARTLAIGSRWRTTARFFTRTHDVAMAALVMTDGVTATSNAVAAIIYVTSTSLAEAAVWHGTLTALATEAWAATDLRTARAIPHIGLEVEYVAANSFQGRFGDGIQGSSWGQANVAKTMTPTHVGVAWSNWGTTGEESIDTFGPLRKIA
jgi:hypothetical protein